MLTKHRSCFSTAYLAGNLPAAQNTLLRGTPRNSEAKHLSHHGVLHSIGYKMPFALRDPCSLLQLSLQFNGVRVKIRLRLRSRPSPRTKPQRSPVRITVARRTYRCPSRRSSPMKTTHTGTRWSRIHHSIRATRGEYYRFLRRRARWPRLSLTQISTDSNDEGKHGCYTLHPVSRISVKQKREVQSATREKISFRAAIVLGQPPQGSQFGSVES